MPRIALVDDDRNVLTSVSIALEAEGYRVATYTGGDTALDGFRAVQPDLAILDIKMPRMDGMEMLPRLRAASDLPVIILTSKEPFSQRLLIERVKVVLRRASPKNGTLPNEAANSLLEQGRFRKSVTRTVRTVGTQNQQQVANSRAVHAETA